METHAFLMSKYGELIPAGYQHIDTITQNPEKFGLHKDDLVKLYKKYKETYGSEGKAREEIIFGLMKNGWLRIRYYPNNDMFNIQIFKLNSATKDLIFDFISLYRKGKVNTGAKSKFSDFQVMDTSPDILMKGDADSIMKELFKEGKLPVAKGRVVLIEDYKCKDKKKMTLKKFKEKIKK